MTSDFEKLGSFYLGRTHATPPHAAGPELVLYDSKDLVTHAVCVGMTGSGKTGLCLSLLEEAAIDGVPAIAIDPKGDISNLLLTFPDLKPEDFRPWINEDDARQKGLTPDAYAAQQAETWRKGLAAWGEDGNRIRKLRDAVEFTIYTPGSRAGVPMSILRSLAAPTGAARDDEELLRQSVSVTATSLLTLVGVDADPLKSREHILLSTIIAENWRQGRDLDVASLIPQIEKPPVSKIGVVDLETFFPAKERFALAMTFNNLLASPGFAAWSEGEALDLSQVWHTKEGKPRISILSIAHLGDSERMFFVALLLNQMVGWVRAQPGTTSLRAILYMDEIAGYFPPVANPPSKPPLLTLLKQARAAGLGVVLATQNPVDLDYKGLSNTGTWFIGRLQTERDKARVLEGLEGASASAGATFDRGRMGETLAGLGNRVFLMNNVHEDAPVVFETRWALSYLRGPLSRAEISRLMADRRALSAQTAAAPEAASAAATTTAATSASAAGQTRRPTVPPDVNQLFVPVRGQSGRVTYEPMVIGSAHVRVTDTKAKVDNTTVVTFIAPITDAAVPVQWDQATEATFDVGDLEREPAEDAAFADLPGAALKAKNFDAWRKAFATWLYGAHKVELLKAPALAACSTPGESERDFRVRLQQAARERRDQDVEALRQKYAPRIAALQERERRAAQAEEREAAQAGQQKLQTAISFGTTLLGAFMGRKAISAATLGRAATAARGVGRSMKEAEDVKRAGETVAAIQQQRAELEEELKEQTAALQTAMAPDTVALERLTLQPAKTGITVDLLALAWVPRTNG